MLKGNSRSRSLRVGQVDRPLGILGLAEIALRHHSPARLPPGSELACIFVRELHRPSGGTADGFPGHVILGRADATGDDHGVRTPHRRRQRIYQSLVVIAHHHLVVGIKAFFGEATPDQRPIAVHDLPQQEFRPDGHHLNDHVSTTSAARSIP